MHGRIGTVDAGAVSALAEWAQDEYSVGTEIATLGAVQQPWVSAMSLLITAALAVAAVHRTDVREHHRWLQKKRREAYVEVPSVTQGRRTRWSTRPIGPKIRKTFCLS